MNPEEDFYEAAADELKNAPRKGLLTKCLAICEGDEIKAKAMYVRERAEELKTEYGRLYSQHAKLQQQRAVESMARESASLEARQAKKDSETKEEEIERRIKDWLWLPLAILGGCIGYAFGPEITESFGKPITPYTKTFSSIMGFVAGGVVGLKLTQ